MLLTLALIIFIHGPRVLLYLSVEAVRPGRIKVVPVQELGFFIELDHRIV